MANKNTPNPEERNRMVTEALAQVPDITGVNKKQSDHEVIVAKAMEVTRNVALHIRPKLRACVHYDEIKIMREVSEAYSDGFKNWSKEELLWLAIFTHTETAMGKINDEMR